MGQFRFLFTAHDYEGTVAFYTTTLGLPVVHSWDDDGRGTIVTAAGSGQIEIFDGDADAAPPAGVALAWEVEDIDAEYAALSARGVEFLGPPQDQPFGHRNATFSAPENLTITLFTVIGEEP
ncbi:MAG: VOC family protein [Acidimicrobiia bacterium]|nr:VOC family protein [Acidimicrobiia bacterium]